MSEYAIYRMEPDATMWDGKTGEILDLISPAQAALRKMTDAEVALLLIRRKLSDDRGLGPSARECILIELICSDDQELIATATRLGLWPKEEGEKA